MRSRRPCAGRTRTRPKGANASWVSGSTSSLRVILLILVGDDARADVGRCQCQYLVMAAHVVKEAREPHGRSAFSRVTGLRAEHPCLTAGADTDLPDED